VPIPFFAFREMYDQVCRQDWRDIGKLPDFALTDEGELVMSALAHPYATADRREVYPTVTAKAAALFRGLVKNHGLRDGNKRMAVTVMSVFLLANGWLPLYTNQQLYRYALRVARREGNYPVASIDRWIRRNTRLMSDRDLATLRRQNRRLRARGDIYEEAFRPLMRPPGWMEEAVRGRATSADSN
jgi:prophage maintenance system killer protein